MKYLPFILLLCACEDLSGFHLIGGEDCIELSDGTIAIGDEARYHTCHTGITQYTKEKDGTETLVCSGGFMPVREYCGNNLDDDCDGKIDYVVYSEYDERNDCYQTEQGVCIRSTKECIDGYLQCVPPKELYGPEICDLENTDENCNGLSNEEDPSIVIKGEEWEYHGEPNTLNVGECRAGHRQCINGRESIYGMRTPVEEICGNGDDDDCDGITDESEEEGGSIDFLISVDGSGSMVNMHSTINQTICDWSGEERWTNSRFAIIFFAVYDGVSEYTNPQRIPTGKYNTYCDRFY